LSKLPSMNSTHISCISLLNKAFIQVRNLYFFLVTMGRIAVWAIGLDYKTQSFSSIPLPTTLERARGT
jgi:hypothetical protein